MFICSPFYSENMLNEKLFAAMTIAGSDSSGGAGIQADLKAFASIGVHGTSTITCITAQNTKKVVSIEPLPLDVIKSQFEAIMEDINPSHVKTGMLYSEEIVRFVAHEIKKRKLIAVVDPVMVSTTGARLSKDGFSNALLEELIPVATLITPNYDEAEELLGKKIRKGDEEDFCKEMKKLGSKYVLLKGGHAKGNMVVDILYDGKEIRKYESVRLGDGKIKYHGTGCTLSALITGYLAKGLDVKSAIEHSKEHILKSIARSYAPGKGVYMIEQLAPLLDDMEKLHILEKMRILRYDIEKIMHPSMIPEVGTNFGYAKSHALKREDICAFDGRIINVGGSVRVISCPSFGASKHVAGIILSSMKYDPEMRCAINIRYSKDMLNAVKYANLKFSSFSREEEPKDVSTMEWGTANAIEKYRKENGKEAFPDVIYDEGGLGKEPMIRVLACTPEELLEKIEKIRKCYIKIRKVMKNKE